MLIGRWLNKFIKKKITTFGNVVKLTIERCKLVLTCIKTVNFLASCV